MGANPGELWVNCMSVFDLVNVAVQNTNDDPLLFSDSIGPFDRQRIRGGPAWAYSDYYSIVARTSDPVANGPANGPTPASKLMRGPMLLSLLEDGFHLRTHREDEEISMYALTVAAGGLKLNPIEDGACGPRDSGVKPECMTHIGWNGPNWTIEVTGQSLARLAGALSTLVDRHVLDKTGITALYSFNLVFAHDTNAPGNLPPEFPSPFPPSNIPPAPSVFAELEQKLGLTLVPDKGPRRYIVIDQLQRP
jgi:uncharacterized protein (TIGR03435 family)